MNFSRNTVNSIYLGIARSLAAAIIGMVMGSLLWAMVEFIMNF